MEIDSFIETEEVYLSSGDLFSLLQCSFSFKSLISFIVSQFYLMKVVVGKKMVNVSFLKWKHFCTCLWQLLGNRVFIRSSKASTHTTILNAFERSIVNCFSFSVAAVDWGFCHLRTPMTEGGIWKLCSHFCWETFHYGDISLPLECNKGNNGTRWCILRRCPCIYFIKS